MKCLILHSCFFVFFLVVWKEMMYLDTHLRQDEKLKQIAELSLRFLTNWTFILLTLTCIGYLVNDVLRLTHFLADFQQKMKVQLDFLFYSIVGPMCLFVPVVFWCLYFADPDLVSISPDLPVDAIMPAWVNHSVHTVPAVIVILHAFFNQVSSFTLRKLLPPVVAYNLLYLVCIYATFYQKDVWVYGFLRKLHEPFRLISVLLLTSFAVLLAYVFNLVNNWHCSKPYKFLYKQ